MEISFIANSNDKPIPNEQYILSNGIYVPISIANPLPTSMVGSLANLTGALATVTTATTRVQLPDVACREITIIAKRANNGYIYVGGSDVAAAKYGAELAAKDSITLAVANANQIYIDASVSGEGISYVAI